MLWNNVVIAINLSASNVKLFVLHFLQSENDKHCIALLCIHSIRFGIYVNGMSDLSANYIYRMKCDCDIFLWMSNESWFAWKSIYILWDVYRLCIDSRIVFSINICTLVYTYTHTLRESWVGNACHTAASCDMYLIALKQQCHSKRYSKFCNWIHEECDEFTITRMQLNLEQTNNK